MRITLDENTLQSQGIQINGLITLAVGGTLDGASVTPSVSFDGGSNYDNIVARDGTEMIFTIASQDQLSIGECLLKLTATSASSNTNIRVDIVGNKLEKTTRL